MTDRERMLAIMAGRMPDRIPWIPRLAIWYAAHRNAGTLPDRWRGWSLRDIERDLGMGHPAREGRIYRIARRGVEVHERKSGRETFAEHVTPAGTVTTLFRGSDILRAAGIGDMQAEYILKTRADYAVAEYMIENTDYVSTHDEYRAYERQVGDSGYPLAGAGDCPFHHWMRAYAGYGNAYYHLADWPAEVERLLALMEARDRALVWPIVAESPARLILHGLHLSTQMTPPPIFERYILPYYRDFSALLRKHGKTLVMHGDADTRAILPLLEAAGFGMVESYVTAPMVPTTLAEARAAWGDRVIIWGGLPSVILEEPYSDAAFERYMDELFDTIAPGNAFVLGVADNVMPGAKVHRLKRVAEMVEERGRCPIGSN